MNSLCVKAILSQFLNICIHDERMSRFFKKKLVMYISVVVDSSPFLFRSCGMLLYFCSYEDFSYRYYDNNVATLKDFEVQT